jgi:hypothetical protein
LLLLLLDVHDTDASALVISEGARDDDKVLLGYLELCKGHFLVYFGNPILFYMYDALIF